jgi:hypothetical protein
MALEIVQPIFVNDEREEIFSSGITDESLKVDMDSDLKSIITETPCTATCLVLTSNDHIMSWKEAMDLHLVLPIEPFS